MKNVFIYGSLKKGFFNHSLISDNPRNKLIRKGFIDGYRLYSLWSYPAIKPSINGERLYVELYSLTDEVFERIDRMEKSAGYVSVEVVDDKDKTGIIYVYERGVDEKRFLPLGNWTKDNERLKIVGDIKDED